MTRQSSTPASPGMRTLFEVPSLRSQSFREQMRPPDFQPGMRQDGRTVSPAAMEEMRAVAHERMTQGESPAVVSASLGMHRGWAYNLRAEAKGGSKGKRASESIRGSGGPPRRDAAQQRQMFRWINGKSLIQHGFALAPWKRRIVRDPSDSSSALSHVQVRSACPVRMVILARIAA